MNKRLRNKLIVALVAVADALNADGKGPKAADVARLLGRESPMDLEPIYSRLWDAAGMLD